VLREKVRERGRVGSGNGMGVNWIEDDVEGKNKRVRC
jgi:hypothetical protein